MLKSLYSGFSKPAHRGMAGEESPDVVLGGKRASCQLRGPPPGLARRTHRLGTSRVRPARELPQHLERVRPAPSLEAGDAPEDAERLDRPRRLDRAQVFDLPAEALEDRS